MSNPNYENVPDSDWDDKGELAWSEYNWKQYLNQNDKTIALFLALFKQLKNCPDRMDEIAHALGWDTEAWCSPEGSIQLYEDDLSDEDGGDYLPYTVHRHPLFIISRSLYIYISQCWEKFLLREEQWDSYRTPSRLVFNFSRTLHDGERNAILATAGLDTGDYNLAICHLKNALAAINEAFACLQQIEQKIDDASLLVDFQNMRQAIFDALFDLRAVWIRVMQKCREQEFYSWDDMD